MTLSEKRAEAGRIGGLTTALRHQGEHSGWGQQGGRRPLATLSEINSLLGQKGGSLRVEDLPTSIPDLLKQYREDSAYEGLRLESTATHRNSHKKEGEPCR